MFKRGQVVRAKYNTKFVNTGDVAVVYQGHPEDELDLVFEAHRDGIIPSGYFKFEDFDVIAEEVFIDLPEDLR